MINPKTDLLPCNQWRLDQWSIQAFERVLTQGSADQINFILTWSYGGCSAAFSERLYGLADRAYPYETNHPSAYPAI